MGLYFSPIGAVPGGTAPFFVKDKSEVSPIPSPVISRVITDINVIR